ncbi:MAG: efflux RND transporter periplasmic adaptor subunit [Prevotellaceae bacterium]|jgi:RND family efflux transporter MFP subunit|nr:efflux RND transporter periplasmic adaptor subunit [Prevotellaceae bacterium]
MAKKTLVVYLILSFLVSCEDKKSDTTQEESVQTELQKEIPVITTDTLKTIDFEHELISNGRIATSQKAELRFLAQSSSNVPVQIFVKNGDHVVAGAAIAMLDTFLLSNSCLQAENTLQKARLDLQEALIGQGYTIDDFAAASEEVMQLAQIRSGYNSAQIQYELAKYNLNNAILRSPISGTVSDLFSKPHSTINTSEPFCRIINQNALEVDFKILENELSMVKMGDKVKVQPYSLPGVVSQGQITNINPSVDADGTVRIKASVQADNNLFNGMNVRISVFRSLGKQWVVPKTAVVLRTGKQVVFACKDNKAAWHYVTTSLENATQYVITSETLKEGDEIIVTGNEHLADGSEVKKL